MFRFLLLSALTLAGPAHCAAGTKAAETKRFKLPLYFVENNGQADARVRYYVQGRDTAVYFTSAGMAVSLSKTSPPKGKFQPVKHTPQRRSVAELEFVRGRRDIQPEGVKRTPAVVSYFNGPKSNWKTGLATYSGVRYSNVWPGVDVVWEGVDGRLKSNFIVRAGADPSLIRLRWRGASGVRVGANGEMWIETPAGGFAEEAPVAYQEDGGRKTGVSAHFSLRGNEYTFRLGEFDRDRELVIDPVTLLYAGYIGETGPGWGTGIAVDASGNAYITGYANSQGNPGAIGPDPTYNGGPSDAFVAKVNAAGTALVYAGYIGGSGRDGGRKIAVDSSGSAYVVGSTWSSESTFPVTVGPDLTYNGGGEGDVFVAKLSPSGTALVYAGYIGGSGDERASGIAVDASGNAYVSGDTKSSQATFPVVAGPGLTFNGAGNTRDTFVAKVSATGASLTYCGYIGGTENDFNYGIAVDAAGNAYVTGETDSSGASFPVAVGPDLSFNGAYDVYVAKVNSAGTALVYCGYIGGAADDSGLGIAVDSLGNAYVTGTTQSSPASFPVVVGPRLTSGVDARDAFVAKVNAAGTALVYAGYIGGSSDDFPTGIAVDRAGNAYVVGFTGSGEATFPVRVGPDLTYNGGEFDAFVAKVNSAGTALAYAGYIGGSGRDEADAIAVDTAGNAYVTGSTFSAQTTFPVTVGPGVTYNGGEAAFVAKISADAPLASPACIGVARAEAPRLFWLLDRDCSGGWSGAAVDGLYKLGQPGDSPLTGDWNGDGRKKIGIFRDGMWLLDYNGNGVWDGDAVDRLYWLGQAGDTPLTGDWSADGRDKIGIFRNGMWLIDYNGNGQWNGGATDRHYYLGQAGDRPVIGDWSGDGRYKIGIFRNSGNDTGMWLLDFNGNGQWDGGAVDRHHYFGQSPGDVPVVGRWQAGGPHRIGFFRTVGPDRGMWLLDLNGNGQWDGGAVDGHYYFGQEFGDRPVIGDWSGDGRDKIGVFRITGLWLIDFNGNGGYNSGIDKIWTLGQAGDTPVVGAW